MNMIGFHDALRIAIEKKPDLDYCTETGNAFIFSKHDSGFEYGPMGPLVVMKDGGICMPVEDYEALDIMSPVMQQGFIG